MGDHAGFEAFGPRVVEAEHLELHGVALALEPIGRGKRLCDQAADLARADVERGHDPLALAPYRGRVSHPRQVFPLDEAALVLAVGISACGVPSCGLASSASRRRTVIRSSRR